MADFNVGGSGGEELVVIRTVLVGAPQVESAAAEEAAAMEGLAAATNKSAVAAEGHSKRSFLMGQALFTLRRVVYSSTLAIGVLGTAAVLSGLQFDSAMEQNTVAMTHFLHGSQAANRELKQLFNIAATTPFEFGQVTDAAKRFLAFGFTVNQTNKYLRTLADTASGVGGGADTINRLVLALGQMQAKGFVMGNELRQMEELGIPALEILQQKLGLTDDQLTRIGSNGIKASIAIPALMAGLDEKFGGLSEKQAKTLQGRLSTFHDYLVQTLGVVMQPLFLKLRDDILPAAIEIAIAIQKGFGQGGLAGSLDALNNSKAPLWFKTLYTFIIRVIETLQILWPTVRDTAAVFGGVFLLALIAVNDALGLFTHHTTLASLAFQILTAWFIYNRLMALRLIVVTRAMIFWSTLQTARIWLYIAASEAYVFWTGRSIIMTRLMAAAMWLLDASFLANPIVDIILVIIGLIAALVLLYQHNKTFRDFINGQWRGSVEYMKQSWAELRTAIFGVVHALEWLYNKARVILGPIIRLVQDLKQNLGSLPGTETRDNPGGSSWWSNLTNFDMPGWSPRWNWDHSGLPGTAPSGDFATAPQQRKHMGAVGGGGTSRREVTHVSKVYLDRRQIGEAVSQYDEDKKARR